jgi:hypothetical protein
MALQLPQPLQLHALCCIMGHISAEKPLKMPPNT